MNVVISLAKYEIKQYLRARSDFLLIAILVAGAFIALFLPMREASELPSSISMYKIGHWQEHPIIDIAKKSSVLSFEKFNGFDKMYSALAEGRLDATIEINGGNTLIVYTHKLKSKNAAGRLEQTLKSVMPVYLAEEAQRMPKYRGIIFPIALRIVEERIDYSKTLQRSFQKPREELQKEASEKKIEAKSYEEKVELKNVNKSKARESEIATKTIAEEQNYILPSQIEIAFPFMDTLRNILIIGPAVMFSMLLTLSLMGEKMTKSLHNLFEAPLKRWQILLGKSLPYLLLMLAMSLLYSFIYASGVDAMKIFFIISSISLLSFSLSVFTAIISRNYRDITSIGSFSVFLFLFLLVIPGVFTGINALAYISPLNNITNIENGAPVGIIDICLSLLPYLMMSLALVFASYVLFDEENILYPKRLKAILRTFFDRVWHDFGERTWLYLFTMVLFSVPIVFIIENLMAYLLLPISIVFPVFLILCFALIEEIIKTLPIYFFKNKNKVGILTYSLSVGLAFFIGEKAMNLYLITKVYSLFANVFSFFIIKNLLTTCAVHILGAFIVISCFKLLKKNWSFILGIALSSGLHAIYNIMISMGVFI
ncbi:hypothetical protein DRN74_00845 [Candidatus Micrarchaeota archaeon]|nr:MAG: hypothetical protein DRN74_00845 [Candidatus Micrarchaeota archaeon]